MKSRDHLLLENLYDTVKTSKKVLTEELSKNESDMFVAKVKNINVYNVDKDQLSLEVAESELELFYEIEFEFRSWGIKGFYVYPKKLSSFSIEIKDDYSQEDFAEPQTILTFNKGLDATNFKKDSVTLKENDSFYPTMIDLWVKKVNDKWEIVSELCEISFI